jgi:DNA-binding MarR family transcriptional regulator
MPTVVMPSIDGTLILMDACVRAQPVVERADGADAFLTSFDAFAQAVRRARGANSQSAENGTLTLSQYALLQALATRNQARVQELAAEAGITSSTATRILDALERRSIIHRTRSPHDRRVVKVTLTEFGREALSHQDEWMRGRQRAFYATLPQVERGLAPDLLMRLAALIDELAAGPDS